MNGSSFNRAAGMAALAIAALSLLYALCYLVLTPGDQRGGDTDTFFRSFAQNSAPYLASWWILAVSGLLTTLVVVAVYSRVRQANESWALWGLILGMTSGLLGTVHAMWEAVRLPAASDFYARVAGDPAYLAAFEVSGQTPSQIDPRGFITFGVLGIWMLVTSALMMRGGEFSRVAAYLALAQGVLLLILFAATALGQGTLILLSGGPASLLVGPAFWVVTGLTLLRGAKAGVQHRHAAAGSAI